MATANTTAKPAPLSGWKRREAWKQTLLTIFLTVTVAFFLFPYYYMIISSWRPPHFDFAATTPKLTPPVPSWAAYDKILNTPLWGMGESISQGQARAAGALVLGFRNTMIFVFAIVLGSTLTSSLAAYAFAKTQFPGRQLLFYIFLYSMIVPGEVTLVPKYVMFHKWHLLGTYWVLIVPGILAAGGWFLMRMFMSTIPDAYLDAARIDGANEWHIIHHVILPMSQPVIFTYMVFTFLGVWNDLMGPLLYVNDPAKYTLQLVLYVIQMNYGMSTGWWDSDITGLRVQMMFAALLMTSLPTILVFAIFQRRIVEGITITGLKA